MKKFACIRALSSYLPEKIELNETLGDKRFLDKIGIYERRISADDETAGDLACRAAENLFAKYDIPREKIDFVMFCTQHPDYQMPTTACQIQTRLGLGENIGAVDYNLGCSGYVYGLAMVKALVEAGIAENVLLLTSSVYTKYINVKDKVLRPLFGDGATATFVTAENSDEPFIDACVFGTDGSKFDKLIIPAGGSKFEPRKTPEVAEEDEAGNIRTNYEVHMDGNAIAYFTLHTVPQLVEDVLQKANLSRQEIDYYIFHQANKFMMKHVQKKSHIENMPFYNNIELIGNVVSGSVPFGILKVLEEKSPSELRRVMLAGFGVGLSWAGCIVNLSRLMEQKK